MTPGVESLVELHGTPCGETRPAPCGLVIFGASGDLAHRKLLPSLFRLHRGGLMPESFFLLGAGRSGDTVSFRSTLMRTLEEIGATAAEAASFAARCGFVAGAYDGGELHAALAREIAARSAEQGTGGSCLFYLALPPDLHAPAAERLGAAGLLRESGGSAAWRRVVVEKPFGRDLPSARDLDRRLKSVLGEERIYRIDHYLGKETVQNIMMLRFANRLFEPLWNREHIDHVQVTVAESVGVESRAGYYEGAGCLRDMFRRRHRADGRGEAPRHQDLHGLAHAALRLPRCIRCRAARSLRAPAARLHARRADAVRAQRHHGGGLGTGDRGAGHLARGQRLRRLHPARLRGRVLGAARGGRLAGSGRPALAHPMTPAP